MATTTNYGWTTPDDTALVKDGAAAIRSLGSAIDTSMNTALGTKKAGLVLLNTTSFSAVASQSINDVFSSTYDNYRIIINWAGSGNHDLDFRFRVSGADNSDAQYNYNDFYSITTTTSNSSTSQTLFRIGNNNTNRGIIAIDITNPFASLQKSYFSTNWGLGRLRLQAGYFGATNSFTGFSIIPSSGTITGSVSTYGYNK